MYAYFSLSLYIYIYICICKGININVYTLLDLRVSSLRTGHANLVCFSVSLQF